MATNQENLNTSNSFGFGNINNQQVLNSDILKNTETTDFNTFTEPAVPTVTVPEIPQQQLTPTEKQSQDIQSQMAEVNASLLGESAFRTQQEQSQGIPELLKTQTDLQNRIKTLTAEQQAIPLQIQQESIGMGRTIGGAAPLETARLRENAINALSTSALLQATQGNISTAQTLVDRAVAAKYDPQREKLNVLKENLQLIIDSPQYSLEQKNRATEQQNMIAKQESALSAKQAEDTQIQSIATEVAKYGASMEVLQAIANAGSVLEATAIAQTTGVYDQEKIQQEFENSLKTGEYNLKRLQYESDLKQQAIDNDISIMQLELDRDKYSTDTDFKNAQLALDQMKANYDVSKIQADIDKIYNDIELSGEPTPEQQIQISKLEQEKAKKKAEEDVKAINLGNQIDAFDDTLSLIDNLTGNFYNEKGEAIPDSQLTPDQKKEKAAANEAIENLVGTFPLGRFPLWSKFTEKNRKLVAGIKQLTSQQTLDTLKTLKASGATLGSVSEKELAILESAGAKLREWEVKDKDGNGVGRWNASEKQFKEELERIRTITDRLKQATIEERKLITPKYESMDDFLNSATEEQLDYADSLKQEFPWLTNDDDILELINEQAKGSSFSKVGSDTDKATLNKVARQEDGSKGGQCGAFVNKLTGLGVGDSFESKMAKMDKSIKEPRPGMVFTMPYSWTGHTGIVVGVEGDDVIVKDSNWGLDEKVQTHRIKKSKISGYAYA